MKFNTVSEKIQKMVEVEEKVFVLELSEAEFAVLVIAVGGTSGSNAVEKLVRQNKDIQISDIEACKFLSAVYDYGYDELGFMG